MQKRIPQAGGPATQGNLQAARLQLTTLISSTTANSTRNMLLDDVLGDAAIADNWRLLDAADVRQKFAALGQQEPSLSAKLDQVLNHLGFQQRQLPALADIESPACRLDVLLKVRATGAIAGPGVLGPGQIKTKAKTILLKRYEDGILDLRTLAGMLNDADAEVAEGAQKTAADLLEKLAADAARNKSEAAKVPGLEVQLRTAQAAADEIPDLETAVDFLSEHVREAEDRLAEARAEAGRAAALRAELAAATDANEELRARAHEAAEEVDRAPKDAPAAIEAHVASLIAQFRTVSEEINRLTSQIASQTGERALLAKENSAKVRALARSSARKAVLDRGIKTRREEYEGSYADEAQHLDALRTQLGVFEIDKQHLPLHCLTKKERGRIAELEEAIGNLTDRNRDRQPKLEAQVARIKEKARTREMEKLRAEVKTSEGLVAEIDAQYTAAVHKFRAEEKEFKRLNEQTIPPLAARLGELNTTLGELNAEIGRLTGELDGKKGEKADITRQISDLAAAERGRAERLSAVLPAPDTKSGTRKR